MDDIEPTQAVPLSDDDDSDSQECEGERRKIRAHIRVKQKLDYPETQFPVFEGTNLIGRSKESDIHIPLKALSKEHACIEVHSENHLIYDKGSRNKTRWLKLYLTPEVRYAIKDGDSLTFGDVKCTYHIVPSQKEEEDVGVGSDTGSETGSESMLDDLLANNTAFVPDSVPIEEDNPSEPSSDLIEPIQGRSSPTIKATLVPTLYATESEDEDDGPVERPFTAVKETPTLNPDVTTVVPESDSEGDLFVKQIQHDETATLCLDESSVMTEGDTSKTCVESTLAYDMDNGDMAPTQAYSLEPADDVEDETVKGAGNVIQSKGHTANIEQTIAYELDPPEQKQTCNINASTTNVSETVAYTLLPQDDVRKKKMTKNVKTKEPAPTDQTVAYNMDIGETDQTVAYDMDIGKIDQTVAYNMDIGGTVPPESSNKNVSETVAYNIDVEEKQSSEEQTEDVERPASPELVLTQSFNVDETQVTEAPILNLGGSSTLAFDDMDDSDTDTEVPPKSSSRQESGAFKVGDDVEMDHDVPTQVFPDAEGSTQALAETQELDCIKNPGDNDATQVLSSDTVAPTASTAGHDGDGDTQVFDETDTIQLSDRHDTQNLDEPCTPVDPGGKFQLEETQLIASAPSAKKVQWAMEATQVFDDDEDIEDDRTLCFTTPAVERPQSTRSMKKTPRTLDETQILLDEESTQVNDDNADPILILEATPDGLTKTNTSKTSVNLDATQNLGDDVSECDATQMLDDTSATLQIEETPCPKQVKRLPHGMHVPEGLTKMNAPNTSMRFNLDATQNFGDDGSECDATQMLDDTSVTLQVEETPHPKQKGREPRGMLVSNRLTKTNASNTSMGFNLDATQNFGDDGFDCDATQMLDDTSATLQVEETPCPKQIKRLPRGMGGSDGLKKTNASNTSMGFNLDATQNFGDDGFECDATQMLDDTSATLQVEETPCPKQIKRLPRGMGGSDGLKKTNASNTSMGFNLDATQNFGDDGFECDATQMLDDTSATLQVEETPCPKQIKRLPRGMGGSDGLKKTNASNTSMGFNLDATQNFGDDGFECDATQMLDDTSATLQVEETPCPKQIKRLPRGMGGSDRLKKTNASNTSMGFNLDATQNFGDDGFECDATQMLDDTSATLQVEETPCPKQVKRLPRGSNEGIEFDAVDPSATQVLNETCPTLEVNETPICSPRISDVFAATQMFSDDTSPLNTSAALNDTCPNLELNLEPSPRKVRDLGSLSPCAATQVFKEDETQIISDSEIDGLSLDLTHDDDEKCLTLRDDGTRPHKSNKTSAPTSNVAEVAATQVFVVEETQVLDMHDDEATQVLDEPEKGLVTTPVKRQGLSSATSEKAPCATSEKAPCDEVNDGNDTQPYNDDHDPIVKEFVHPDDIATQAYGAASDDECSESDDIDFGVPIPILPSPSRYKKGNKSEIAKVVADTVMKKAAGQKDEVKNEASITDSEEITKGVDAMPGDEEATQAYALYDDNHDDTSEEEKEEEEKMKTKNEPAEASVSVDDSVILLEEPKLSKGTTPRKKGRPRKSVAAQIKTSATTPEIQEELSTDTASSQTDKPRKSLPVSIVGDGSQERKRSQEQNIPSSGDTQIVGKRGCLKKSVNIDSTHEEKTVEAQHSNKFTIENDTESKEKQEHTRKSAHRSVSHKIRGTGVCTSALKDDHKDKEQEEEMTKEVVAMPGDEEATQAYALYDDNHDDTSEEEKEEEKMKTKNEPAEASVSVDDSVILLEEPKLSKGTTPRKKGRPRKSVAAQIKTSATTPEIQEELSTDTASSQTDKPRKSLPVSIVGDGSQERKRSQERNIPSSGDTQTVGKRGCLKKSVNIDSRHEKKTVEPQHGNKSAIGNDTESKEKEEHTRKSARRSVSHNIRGTGVCTSALKDDQKEQEHEVKNTFRSSRKTLVTGKSSQRRNRKSVLPQIEEGPIEPSCPSKTSEVSLQELPLKIGKSGQRKENKDDNASGQEISSTALEDLIQEGKTCKSKRAIGEGKSVVPESQFSSGSQKTKDSLSEDSAPSAAKGKQDHVEETSTETKALPRISRSSRKSILPKGNNEDPPPKSDEAVRVRGKGKSVAAESQASTASQSSQETKDSQSEGSAPSSGRGKQDHVEETPIDVKDMPRGTRSSRKSILLKDNDQNPTQKSNKAVRVRGKVKSVAAESQAPTASQSSQETKDSQSEGSAPSSGRGKQDHVKETSTETKALPLSSRSSRKSVLLKGNDQNPTQKSNEAVRMRGKGKSVAAESQASTAAQSSLETKDSQSEGSAPSPARGKQDHVEETSTETKALPRISRSSRKSILPKGNNEDPPPKSDKAVRVRGKGKCGTAGSQASTASQSSQETKDSQSEGSAPSAARGKRDHVEETSTETKAMPQGTRSSRKSVLPKRNDGNPPLKVDKPKAEKLSKPKDTKVLEPNSDSTSAQQTRRTGALRKRKHSDTNKELESTFTDETSSGWNSKQRKNQVGSVAISKSSKTSFKKEDGSKEDPPQLGSVGENPDSLDTDDPSQVLSETDGKKKIKVEMIKTEEKVVRQSRRKTTFGSKSETAPIDDSKCKNIKKDDFTSTKEYSKVSEGRAQKGKQTVSKEHFTELKMETLEENTEVPSRPNRGRHSTVAYVDKPSSKVPSLRKSRSHNSLNMEDIATTSQRSRQLKTESKNDIGALPSTEARAKRRGSPDSQASNLDTKKRRLDRSKQTGRGSPSRSQQSQASVLSTPGRRQRAEKPRIMFTGVTDDKRQKARLRVIKKLGGELAENIFECTHIVTDKIRRTVKFLCGIARGLPVVTTKWLDACGMAKTFVDVTSYLISDPESEKSHDFKLDKSISMAAEKPMLQGHKIHVTKSVKPEPQQMKDIITCAGGEFLSNIPKKAEGGVVIVSCADDKTCLEGALAAGIHVVSSEFLLTGVLRQIVDLHTHQLFPSATGPTEAKKRRR